MELLKYLETHTLDELVNKYDLIMRQHKEYSNLILLKYNQIGSDMSEPIVQECRGIILDTDDNYRVVCRSFNKFFNDTEGHAADIDWDTAKIFEKLDGSLCQLYYYDEEWKIATSGSADASGNVGDFDFTFKELFWRVWKELRYKLPTDTGVSFFFELVTPYNRIVVDNPENSLTLLGARRLSDFKELNPVVEAHYNGWKCVQLYDFDDIDEIKEVLETMNGHEQEGFVVCDSKYRRIKLKCDDYIKKHRLVSSMSKRNMLDVIRTNESDEVMPSVPQFKELHWDIRTRYEYLVGEITGFYDGIKHLDDRKQFAQMATQKFYSGVLFSLKFNNVSIRESLAGIHIKALEKWLDLKEEEE